MLASGLEGIENRYKLSAASDVDVNGLTDAERKKAGIGVLPKDLSQAIEEAEGSLVLKKALGDHVFEKFIENKKIEWDQYRAQVTSYELDQYLKVL